MTRVLIPAPAIEADVSAEQVVAPAVCVCGHRKSSHGGATNRGGCTASIRTYGERGCPCSRFLDVTSRKGIAALAEQAERARRNIAADDETLADITGPARGVEGRRCRGADTREDYDPGRVACMVKMMAKRWRERSAPHGAQEESDQ